MWPFKKKKDAPVPAKQLTLREALERVAEIGIRTRSEITIDDLLFSLEGSLDSPTDPITLLCVLGGQVERKPHQWISDNIWHSDAECIIEDGDYIALAKRFAALTKGALPISDIKDHIDLEAGEVWLAFSLRNERIKWNLEVKDDWCDPMLYSNFQTLVEQADPDKRFFICGLGQDSLIGYGDAKMKNALSGFAGIKFSWE
ncbi:MAG: hypothetical protein JWM68_201 [Verrucomicrobiales bacterium]|nr:hypothetical protein [Verrucomicrobiales bacterium]